ncbi:MAG: hypothetical protein KAT48_10690 [Bacteroidales bacterium]|nr:hypothetical protein [Bacteroidales bacterium]
MKKNVVLVLSGGGARGIAHIGVIEELEKQGFDINLFPVLLWEPWLVVFMLLEKCKSIKTGYTLLINSMSLNLLILHLVHNINKKNFE